MSFHKMWVGMENMTAEEALTIWEPGVASSRRLELVSKRVFILLKDKKLFLHLIGASTPSKFSQLCDLNEGRERFYLRKRYR